MAVAFALRFLRKGMIRPMPRSASTAPLRRTQNRGVPGMLGTIGSNHEGSVK